MREPLTFTIHAAAKVWELIKEEENFNLKLRVYVTGGGCSGMQYGFSFDETINEDDTIIVQTVEDNEGQVASSGGGKHQVQLLVDSMSFQYLKDAEIDYKEDIEGSQFIIRNPNAKTTCGCGSSFSSE
jgi:iron-sulfur cluster insertion protein